MKLFILISIFLASTGPALCQTTLVMGDDCFKRGDYVCAQMNYQKAMSTAAGREKQIVEIKLSRAKSCNDWLNQANNAFLNEAYQVAKENYEKVISENPDDSFAKAQLEKCDIALKPLSTLSISKESLTFAAAGGRDSIMVTTNENTYSIVDLPSWCIIQKFSSYFVITLTPNLTSITRNGVFSVNAGGKTKQVNVSQTGLRKATSADINDIWNNKFGYMPIRRSNLIAAGIDPDDAQSRINRGEGSRVITLSVSKENITLLSGKSEIVIDVKTNAPDYQITNLPTWCRVGYKYIDSFTLICDENRTTDSRSETFVITAGDKKINLYINQAKGKSISKSKKPNTSFFAIGYEGGEIANYGFRMEFGGRRFVGMFLNVRSSFISDDEILNHFGFLENKNEGVIGLNFKIFKSVFLNLGGGYGFFKQLTNEKLEEIEYFPAYGGLTLRLGRRINLSGGISFSDIEQSYNTNIFDPEYTLGLTINLKK